MDVKLRIHRFVEGRKWEQDYTVTLKTGMTVLEALIEIKEKQDPTLSFTCSCRSSICGACAVRVNGNAELACEMLVENLVKRYDTNELIIEPLGNFKVIRDLVVDWDPNTPASRRLNPWFSPSLSSLRKQAASSPPRISTNTRNTPAAFSAAPAYPSAIRTA